MLDHLPPLRGRFFFWLCFSVVCVGLPTYNPISIGWLLAMSKLMLLSFTFYTSSSPALADCY
jgi:hypothetical protein